MDLGIDQLARNELPRVERQTRGFRQQSSHAVALRGSGHRGASNGEAKTKSRSGPRHNEPSYVRLPNILIDSHVYPQVVCRSHEQVRYTNGRSKEITSLTGLLPFSSWSSCK